MTMLGRITCGTFIRKWEHIRIEKLSKHYFHTLKNNSKQNVEKIYCLTSRTTMENRINSIRKIASKKNGAETLKTDGKIKSEIHRLLLLAKPEKWKLTGAIILLIASSTVTMAVPFGLGKIIDVIYVTDDKDKTRTNVNRLCLGLLGIAVIGGICNFGRIYYMSTSGYRITQRLRKTAYTAILSQETAMFDRISTGELVGRLTGDAQLVSSAVTSNISDGLRSSIMTIAGVSMMFYVSPQLALVGLMIVPPVAGFVIIYGRSIKKISKNIQSSLATLNTTAEEKISNIRTVKAFAQEKNEINNYSKKLNDLLELCYHESLYRAIFFGITGFSGYAVVLSVLYYGGVMISDSSITVGSLSSFLLYAVYTGLSFSGITNFYSELNRAIGASSRLFEFIERKPLIPMIGGKILDHPLTGDVIFDKIHFKYPTRDDCSILSDFSLHLSPCSVNAIVGPSGSGKSTIALLLLRLYEPNSGNILLDNWNLKELDSDWVKSQIGFVSQEPVLFSGTIGENIGYGLGNDVDDDKIIEAAKLANVLEFTERMSDGLDTVVGERGITLSGGQRQRVAIARALIKNPRILILDEATSALDAESENYVQEALERATQGRTVLTIAHRLSTIKNADRIAVLDDGRVIENGTYNELIQIEDGLFKKLVKHQTFS